MSQTYSVEAVLSAVDRGFSKTFGSAEKNVQGLSKELPNVGTKTNALQERMIGLGKAVAGAFAVQKVMEFGKAVLESAADAAAMESQFEQVFEGTEDEATGAMDNIVKEAGMLPNRIKPAFSAIASFAKVNGMETAEAIEFTERATLAAADSAAFYDKSIEETTETLKSYLKGNFAVADNLGILSTETTRNAKATEMFGASYKELDGVQQQGVLLAMFEDANRLGGAMGQAAREADQWENQVGNLKQAWKEFQVALGQPFLDIAVKLIKMAAEGMMALAGHVTATVERFSVFWESIKAGEGYFGRILNVIKSFVGGIQEAFTAGDFSQVGNLANGLLTSVIDLLIGGIPKLLQTGATLINKLADGMGMSIPELANMAITIITKFITGFIGNIPMIINTGIKVLQGLITGITTAIPILLSSIRDIMLSLVTAILNSMPEFLNAAINLVGSLMEGLMGMAPFLMNAVMGLFNSVVTLIATFLPEFIAKGMEIVEFLINGAIGMLPMLIDMAVELITTIVDMIVANLPMIIQSGITILNTLVAGITNALPGLIDAAIELAVTIFNTLMDNLPMILEAGVSLLLALVDGVLSMIPEVITAAWDIINAIWDTIKDVDWLSIGADIIAGIGKGIASAAGALWDTAKGVLGSFKDNILGFFGIKSPSRWGRDIVGKMIPAGIGLGIEKGESKLLKTASSMSNALASTIQTPTVDISGSVARTTGGIKSAINHSLDMGTNNMTALLEKLANQQQVIVMDTGELVGATYPTYDRTGGTHMQLQGRWGR